MEDIPDFVKVNKDLLIHKNTIMWIKNNMDDCISICNKMECMQNTIGIHKICKINNPELYAKLHAPFLPCSKH